MDRALGSQSQLDLSTNHRLFLGFDSRRISPSQVANDSVHLVATSPPYWNIKDYGNPNQIGFGDALDEYFEKLNKVWKECVRVLMPGCRLCINIGDEYLRASDQSPYNIIPLHAHLVNEVLDSNRGKVIYLGSIIWNKISTTNTSGGASVMGSWGRPRNGYVSYNFEYVAIFKKLGKAPVPDEMDPADRIELEEWRTLFNGTWSFQGERQKGGMAMFPDELPRRLIRMFTFKGDTVLDPFLGSGTTSKVAFEMGRNSVGYELGFRPNDGRDWKDAIFEKVHYNELTKEERERVFSITVKPRPRESRSKARTNG